MTVNKGLTSLANSTPNFSNQALENAIITPKEARAEKATRKLKNIAKNYL